MVRFFAAEIAEGAENHKPQTIVTATANRENHEWTRIYTNIHEFGRGWSLPSHAALGAGDLFVAEAGDDVVVDEAGGLHVGVADGGTDEGESAFF